MRIELAQIRKYSPSDDIVNEIIYYVYDIFAENALPERVSRCPACRNLVTYCHEQIA